MSITKRQKTVKQSIGKNVVILGPALGINAVEHVLTIRGRIRSATLDTDRTDLEALQDGQRHGYDDGVRAGDYAILSLRFNDTGGTAGLAYYDYDMVLVEW